MVARKQILGNMTVLPFAQLKAIKINISIQLINYCTYICWSIILLKPFLTQRMLLVREVKYRVNIKLLQQLKMKVNTK